MLSLNKQILWHGLLLLALSAATFLTGLGTPGLYDPNEGIYAEVAWEMRARGDWISPTFNGVPYFEKPPLHYWLIAAAYALFGVSETAARLPAALAAVAGVLLTFGIGRLVFTPRAGLLAGLALTTSFGYFLFARLTKTDQILTACVTAALWCFLRAYLDPERRRSYLPAYLFAALAVLTKGLLGLVLPGLIVGGLLLVTRDWRLVREMRLPLGTALLLGVAAPWHLAAAWAHPGFAWFYFVNEHALRFLNKRHLIDYAPLPVPLFLLMALVWAFPWSLFLPFGWRRLIPPSGDGRKARAAWIVPSWIVAVLGFFALMPARLEYYSLPVLPAFALWIGRSWDDVLEDPGRRAPLCWALAGLLALGLGVTLLAAGVSRLDGGISPSFLHAVDAYSRDIEQGILAPPGSYTLPSSRELSPLVWLTAGVLLVGAAAALLAAWLGRLRLAFACLVGLMLGLFPLIHQGLALVEPHRSVRPLAASLVQARRPGDVVVVEGPYENFAALNMYTGGSALVLNGRFGDLAFGSQQPQAQAAFLDDGAFDRLWASPARVFLLTGSADRADALRQRAETAILRRAGQRWLLVNRP